MKKATLVLLLITALASFGLAQDASVKPVQVTGTLVRVAGPGGETTGWAIELDKPLTVTKEGTTLPNGKRVVMKLEQPWKQIEVKFDPKQLDPLEDKRVTATGKLTQMTGVERGAWPVLELGSIRELQGK